MHGPINFCWFALFRARVLTRWLGMALPYGHPLRLFSVSLSLSLSSFPVGNLATYERVWAQTLRRITTCPGVVTEVLLWMDGVVGAVLGMKEV